MAQESLNEGLIIDGLKEAFPQKKPLLISQNYGLENIFLVQYQYPPHELPEHAVPYNVLEVIDRRYFSPHKRRLADNLYTKPLRGGEVFFYPQHCDHHIRWDKEMMFTLLNFRPQLFEQEFGCSSSAELFPYFQECNPEIYTLVNLIIEGLKQEYINVSYIDCLALALAKHLVPLMGLRYKVTQESQLAKKIVKELVDFIESEIELGRKPTLPELTKQAGFQSQSYFSKLFKKDLGVAPCKYVTQRAIERAKYLLKKTDIAFLGLMRYISTSH
ncbi:MAG: AraC family transcriptional regulator [Spirulinaceae cyanobacterium]